MFNDILVRLNGAKANEHTYFKECSNHYLENLAGALATISEVVSNSQFEDIMKTKLKVDSRDVDKKSCIQALCEITVQSYFAKHFKDSFVYEPRLRKLSDKNPEFSYRLGPLTIAVEIKCATFEDREKNNTEDTLHVHVGIVPDKSSVPGTIRDMDAIAKLGGYEGAVNMKNMILNLKDYLIGANEKFNPDSTTTDINVLIIGCDDPSDMDLWVDYLYGNQGLFQKDPLIESDKYNLVDIVLVTNLYNKHKMPEMVANDYNVFDYENTFIVGFPNPRPKLCKVGGVCNFLVTTPNQTSVVSSYVVPGSAEAFIKSMTQIASFVSTHPEYQSYFVSYANPVP